MGSVHVTERPFSDLLRHPKDVAVDVEAGDVILRRRDQPDLWLSRADRETERSQAFAVLARTLRNLALRSPDALTDALVEVFSWTEVFPISERSLFVEDFSRVATAAADLDDMRPLTQLLREWRATAEVYADPELAKRLRLRVDAHGQAVAVPTG